MHLQVDVESWTAQMFCLVTVLTYCEITLSKGEKIKISALYKYDGNSAPPNITDISIDTNTISLSSNKNSKYHSQGKMLGCISSTIFPSSQTRNADKPF